MALRCRIIFVRIAAFKSHFVRTVNLQQQWALFIKLDTTNVIMNHSQEQLHKKCGSGKSTMFEGKKKHLPQAVRTYLNVELQDIESSMR